MSEHFYAVIMAGGGGTRLWPLSRQARPKQMLKLGGERTLFQISVDRLKGLFPVEQIYVVTAASQAEELQSEIPEIPEENYVLEPEPRGTASAIGLSAVVLQKRDPQAMMAVVTADHFIKNEKKFLHILKAGREAASQGYLVTLGIRPTFPAVGFGYIQRGGYLDTFSGVDVFIAQRFVEKPDRQTAESYFKGEEHSWNSGMFIWRTEVILGEIERQMPTLHSALLKIGETYDTPQKEEVFKKYWMSLYSETIDYGIMEQAKNVVVVPARGLGWSDVGNWSAIYHVLPDDDQGNVIQCKDHMGINTNNTLVFANGNSDRLIATIGIEDLVIVDTGDVLLVCSREQAQDVREIVNLLKEKGKIEYL
jgi:mannose-1-phosphate guanylyltransferase